MAPTRPHPRRAPGTGTARPRRHPVALVLTILAAVAALVGACSSGADGAAPSTTTTSSTTTTTAPPDPGPGPTSLEGVTARLETVVAAGGDETPRFGIDGIEIPRLDQPVALAVRPERNQVWVAERPGRLRVLTRETSWNDRTDVTERGGYTLLPGSVLDISGMTDTEGERGLLGIAFASDGRTVYLHHTLRSGDVVVAAYTVEDERPYTGGTGGQPPPVSSVVTIDEGSRVELLRVPHEQFANHNGGQLATGPDGYLYVGIGDGGGAGDPDGRGQDPNDLLGTIVRIDPAAPGPDRPYSVPPDNPFVGSDYGAPEVYLYGVRNPWRFSFDRGTGDLWVADVGQDAVEEIDWLPALFGAGNGANLGWSWYEGDQRFRTDGTPPEGVIGPLHTYDHTEGRCSITGGYVYRGPDAPALDGVYVYGDLCTGEIRGLLSRAGLVLDDRDLGIGVEPGSLVSFGEGEDGELFVLTLDGALSRVVA